MNNRDYYSSMNVQTNVKAEYLHFNDDSMVVSMYYLPKHSSENIKLSSEVVPYYRICNYMDEWMDRLYVPFDYITVVDNKEDYRHVSSMI